MIDFDALALIIGITILLVLLIILKFKNKKCRCFLLFYSIMFIYLLYVLKSTIFSIPIDPEILDIMNQGKIKVIENINLVPLKFKEWLPEQVFLNILLSMPFGFGINFLIKTGYKRIFVYGVGFGLCIELLQLFISLIIGFSYRTVDINDIILNFTGVIIGYWIFEFFSYLFIKTKSFFNIKNNELLDYIESMILNKGVNGMAYCLPYS